ncbi:MAG: nitroreductase family protein [Chloroflexi bacterium]|nr:nitroreductase family protein [Chloroflexota bacterium]
MVTTESVTELSNLLKSRRSIRAWQDKPVPEELLLQAIELATWAPNGGNQQIWRFYLVTNRQVINAMADAVDKISAEINSWPETAQLVPPPSPPLPGAPPQPAGRKPGFFRQAPAAIVVAASQYQSAQDKILEERSKHDPRATQLREWRNVPNSRIQSVSAAITQLLLVLHSMGLGAIWMTGPMVAKGDIEKILKIPATMDAVTLIPVGYPAETPVSRGRKPVGEICEVIR